MKRGLESIVSICQRVVLEAKVTDALKPHSEGLHVLELGKKTGLHPGKLGRILRLLATKHCFREVRKDVYANNRLSFLLSLDEEIGVYLHMTGDELYRSGMYLSETLLDKAKGHSLDPALTAFATFYKDPLWVWWLEHPRSFERFRVGMAGCAGLENLHSAEKGFPWGDAPPGTIVNDVGGGLGYMTMHIAKMHPNINVIVQDLEETVNQAIGYWNGFGPELVEADRVDFLPFDFFQESPIPDCDYYYLKHIMHNWTDDAANIILTNVKKVMKPSARLIIQEYIIQSTSEDGIIDDLDLLPRAPRPLLPNYGEGHIMRYYMDIIMMELLNSAQRTLVEYKILGERAGLEFVRAYDCGELSALEFKLPSS